MASAEPIRFTDGSPMLLAGLRRRHTCADAPRTIMRQWDDFRSLPPLPDPVGGLTYGVICGAAVGGIEYMSAMQVHNFDSLPGEMGRLQVPAQHYAVFEHRGHVSGIRALWQAVMDDWLPRSGFQSAHRPDFERYDERFDSGTRSGVVELWLGVIRL